MKAAIRTALAILPAAVLACSSPDSMPPPPVPAEITLGGTAFTAWRADGATFRIVCQTPCPIEEPAIFALYAGMARAKQAAVDLAGIDVLASLTPVDVHVTADAVCGPLPTVAAGYSTIGPDSRGRLCLFTWESSHPPKPYLPAPIDGKLEHQVLFVHEYSHVIFFGRHHVPWESVVRAISYQVTGSIVDACDSRLETFSARLIRELCVQDGFAFRDLAPSLRALDAIYQAGAGEIDPAASIVGNGKPPTSVHQWRKILDRQLGKSTLKAFMDADEVSYNRLGDEVTITPAGGRFELYRGAVVLDVPAGAVNTAVEIRARFVARLGSAAVAAGWGVMAFDTVEDLQPHEVRFAQPVTLSIRYDGRRAPSGGDLQALRLIAGTDVMSMAVVPDSAPDLAASVVRGSIAGLGYFFAGPQP